MGYTPWLVRRCFLESCYIAYGKDCTVPVFILLFFSSSSFNSSVTMPYRFVRLILASPENIKRLYVDTVHLDVGLRCGQTVSLSLIGWKSHKLFLFLPYLLISTEISEKDCRGNSWKNLLINFNDCQNLPVSPWTVHRTLQWYESTFFNGR